MLNQIRNILIGIALIATTCTMPAQAPFSFAAWKQHCDALPILKKTNAKTALRSTTFLQQLNDFITTIRTEQNNAHWVNNVKPSYAQKFNPFMQKVVVPAGSKIAFHGDLHGDIHSLNHFIAELIEKKYLNDALEIIDPTFYAVFLGDYTDRGTNGIEVLSTIMHLKTASPNKVFLVRGNHEDVSINNKHGFWQEIKTKFKNKNNVTAICGRLADFYNMLPCALYLGTRNATTNMTNYIQCCHGGIEARVNPQPLLQSEHNHAYGYINETMRCIPTTTSFSALLKNYLHTPMTSDNGFMWSDFAVNPDEETKNTRGGCCGLQVNKQDTYSYLNSISTKYHQVCAFFRAHQHGDPHMDALILSSPDAGVSKLWGDKKKNIEKLWPGAVCTFSVAPAAYKNNGYTKDYFGILTTAQKFKDWRLKMYEGYKPI